MLMKGREMKKAGGEQKGERHAAVIHAASQYGIKSSKQQRNERPCVSVQHTRVLGCRTHVLVTDDPCARRTHLLMLCMRDDTPRQPVIEQ